MTTALGVYDLYVNGNIIGNTEVLKPGYTHVRKTRRAFTYDITPIINTNANATATNQLSVSVTPGWWSDKIVTLITIKAS